MKLRYKLDTGDDLVSPKLDEETAEEFVQGYLEYVNTKGERAGGYLKDGKHCIDLSHIIAITIIRKDRIIV